jgi:hypothetical protein
VGGAGGAKERGGDFRVGRPIQGSPDHTLAILRQARQDKKPVRQLATELVDGMIRVHSIEPALHRVLLDEAPRHDGSRAIQGIFETEYMGRYKALVAAGQSRATAVDIDMAAQVLSSAVEGVIHNAARRGMQRHQT